MEEPGKRRRLTEAEGERLVAEYAPLVQSIALSLLRRLPANVEGDDLMQDGYIGLMAAILQSTKERAGGHFKSYISQRVRGAMLDGLRRADPASNRMRQEMRRVERAIHRLSHCLGRAPSEGEIAAALEMPLAAYQELLMDAHGYTLLSLEDFDDPDPAKDFIDWCAQTNSDPLAALERKAVQRTLLIAISDLTPREEQIMTMYYVSELTMKDIGARLDISEGRISQIHAQAIAKLRAAVIGDDTRPSLFAPRWRAA